MLKEETGEHLYTVVTWFTAKPEYVVGEKADSGPLGIGCFKCYLDWQQSVSVGGLCSGSTHSFSLSTCLNFTSSILFCCGMLFLLNLISVLVQFFDCFGHKEVTANGHDLNSALPCPGSLSCCKASVVSVVTWFLQNKLMVTYSLFLVAVTSLQEPVADTIIS